MAWKTLDALNMHGKTVLVRVDINVPVEDGRVSDATRIERIKPTVDAILDAGGKPVLMAHFGRPKGAVVPEMSLSLIKDAVAGVLDVPVTFASDCVGSLAAEAIAALPLVPSFCWKTRAFTQAKKRTTRILPQRWPLWAIFM